MVKVLLTGGSGFIAAHIVNILLQHGFDTVVTVRSEEKGKRIIEAHPDVSKEKLSYVIVQDVAKDGAFDEDPVKDFLDPAIKGTTGILKAIKEYAPTVKRVVITSSFAAIVNGKQHPKVYSEKEWNPLTWEEAMDHSSVYRGSKTFAEKAAWSFVEKEKPNFDLATINPPLVFGPIVHYLNSPEAINTSNQRLRNIVQGEMKEKIAPTGNFLWVDVRDVALAHVRAIEVPEAGGERFFVTAGFFSNKELADIARETHPQLESKLPPVDAPSDFPEHIYEIDNTKSQKVLGLKYHPLKQTVSDAIDSILAVGI
ncbi:hypothetical protein N7449_001332 [Penicillium cf. viridicatum]|uniref:NAD-dependent epimerase/dehydratase domain-containing protein n=1 Tax=Penicillium cf. viridicatum TaxID=2972119 RepID=A0A9W9N7Z8_9EURO|nr:hypothetical protein N7449_001332 [Penicillium cf. viridicatum]